MYKQLFSAVLWIGSEMIHTHTQRQNYRAYNLKSFGREFSTNVKKGFRFGLRVPRRIQTNNAVCYLITVLITNMA